MPRKQMGRPRKTECKWGHPLVEGNLYYGHVGKYPSRFCRTCQIANAKRRHAEKKTAAIVIKTAV